MGDKTTLAVGPIVAACGVPFGKMSGRGLGHTGGTLDKLESIPGFRVELTTDEFVAQVREIGLAIVGQSADLVPADKKLYALRDVTATVDNVSLIAASIMSKKIAAGADAIVLDVKVGDGAFMKSLRTRRCSPRRCSRSASAPAATSSACSPTWTSRSGTRSATRSRCARRSRRSAARGRPTSRELVLDASAHLLALSDLGVDEAEARRRAEAAVADGSAAAAYERWVRAQGGDPDEAALPKAPVVREVFAPRSGYVQRLAALPVGLAALELGAGRRDEGRRDRPRGRRRLPREARRRGRRGRAARRGARARRALGREAAADVLAAYELGDEPPRVAADHPRHARLAPSGHG